ncbi:uncharacterized protein LOC114129450 isoform X1 [Aphis gossypii]|uniref:Uncharacterized protein n=1 Tax=Aphis gossypii TaxID=80765 RepID=A0A9P0JB03_APHGO|nr:uncharacterized protein LOC114129450 isoform X1 [Aphis gossypii]CAH1732415.1 unnamed protein product [Aphis gossypii]
MSSPHSVATAGQEDLLNDFDLDDLGSTLDIVHEIDKFLEGLASDGPDLPVSNDQKINETNIADLEVVDNNRTSTTQVDVEFVGKDSAVFQLLEDHENYGVYEHNPNECNWNVFYKTLPPGEEPFVKVEPKTEIVNDYFLSDTENKLESFSFNLDNVPENSIFEQHSFEASTGETDAATSEITYSDNELENFSFTLKADNIKDNVSSAEVKRRKPYKKFKNFNFKSNAPIPHQFRNNNYKNTFRKPHPWHRKDSMERNNGFQQAFKNQYQGNSSLMPAPNNDNAASFPPRNYNLQSNRANSNNFNKVPNEIQGNKNVAQSDVSFTKEDDEMKNFKFVTDNSQFIMPKYIESPSINIAKQMHRSSPPIFKSHSVVGEYLCPVSLVGTTIKFLSRKLANTGIREQIVVELTKHGILENNWWTPDDLFYVTFAERSIAQHVFKLYPHNSKNSY